MMNSSLYPRPPARQLIKTLVPYIPHRIIFSRKATPAFTTRGSLDFPLIIEFYCINIYYKVDLSMRNLSASLPNENADAKT